MKGGIEAFKEAIAKGEVKVERVLDEADNVIVDEEGNILNKAITKEGEEVELLEKVNIKSDGLLTRLNNASFKVLKGKFEELDDVLKQKFLSDFDDVPDQILHKLQDEDLVDAWRILDDAGVDEILRRNVEALADPDATLDAIQMSQKTKPTWEEIQVLFKRGNDYNARARLEYGDNRVEVVLKGVDGKAGKRLDTYIPPANGQAGQIISRKATTLSEIQPNTFRNYLNELITKYPKGAELNSSKFPSRTTLNGDHFLEIPTSNKSFFELSNEFQQVLSDFNISNGVNVKIKYLDE